MSVEGSIDIFHFNFEGVLVDNSKDVGDPMYIYFLFELCEVDWYFDSSYFFFLWWYIFDGIGIYFVNDRLILAGD